jgi:hypothetical protein
MCTVGMTAQKQKSCRPRSIFSARSGPTSTRIPPWGIQGLAPEEVSEPTTFRLRDGKPSSSRCRPGPFWLLRSAGSSAEYAPDLSCYGRGNDQENDRLSHGISTEPWLPPGRPAAAVASSRSDTFRQKSDGKASRPTERWRVAGLVRRDRRSRDIPPRVDVLHAFAAVLLSLAAWRLRHSTTLRPAGPPIAGPSPVVSWPPRS